MPNLVLHSENRNHSGSEQLFGTRLARLRIAFWHRLQQLLGCASAMVMHSFDFEGDYSADFHQSTSPSQSDGNISLCWLSGSKREG
jgi:hypothetical protein